MKDFFGNIIEFVKSHLIMTIAAGVVVVAGVVCLIVFLPSGQEPETPVSTVIESDISPTPIPTEVPTPTPEIVDPTPTPTPEPVPADPSHEGEVISVIDGTWIPEEVATKRPYAIMFNNIGVANPQSGIGDAKILYEALAEGGITRLMGTIVECLADDKGLVWPDEVAPFKIHLISLGLKDENLAKCNEIYNKLISLGFDVLYDDRNVGNGEKLGDSDLIGIPHRLVVSQKTLAENKIEYKNRRESDSKLLSLEEVLKLLK